MTNGYNTPIGVPIGLPSILSLGLPPLVNPYPTLNLDFINNPQFDSRITFSRGSQATLFDSTGTLVYAKHNLLLQSEDFTTTWIATNATVAANAVVAPSGATTGDKLIVDNGVSSGSSSLRQDVTKAASAITYTLSVFAKKGEADTLRLLPRDTATSANNVDARFNLDAGTVVSVTAAGTFTNASAAIQNAGNGWYRCSMTFTSGTETSIRSQIFQQKAGANFTGNGTDGIFIWGAQFNLANMEGGVTSSLTTYYSTTTAAYYAPRFDYNPSTLQPRGLLIEEQRTNSIRNNTMQGAVAGSPGTLPTNWAWSATTAGLTVEVIGTGVESGITYIDLKMSGTADGTAFTLGFEPSSIVTASSGQTWTLSTYSRIVGGSLSNIVYNLSITEQNGGSVLTSGAVAVTPTTDPLNSQRFSFTRTLTNASTNNIRPRPRFDTTAGAVDLTLRIGLPQLELGAFATSVIPTTTTALTRNADVATMTGTNFSSWYNQSEGSVMTNFAFVGLRSVAGQRIITFDDGSSTNLIAQSAGSTNALVSSITDAGSTQMASTSPATTFAAAATYKMGFAYALNNSVAAVNATIGTVDSACTIPTGITTLRLAASAAALTASCWFQRLSFYPTRLPDATLQALTA